jgi:disulfide oxidoreductase YuzD
MAELRAPEQNRLLGQLARMLRTTEGDIAAPEFLPKSLDVMGLVRQLMLPSAETVEKLSYGDPLFRMPTQSNIPITADREYLADIAGMIPFGAPAARPSARAMQDLVRQIQTEPPTGAITPRASLLDQPAQSVVENPFQTAFTQVSPGDEVAGLTVREYVPNIDSISASLDNYEVLSGIRKVPARAFDAEYLDSLRDRGLDKRTADLSEQIKQSKEINPLIVAVDSKGAYIVEGGHRFDALMTQGRESVPAKVVIDQDDPPTEDFLRSLFE